MKRIRYVVCLLATLLCMTSTHAGITPPSTGGTSTETETETEEKPWIEIELESAGNLGVEILYKADRLADVTHLRVSGPINDTDWGNIKNLTKIQELDLSKAITTTIPDDAFYWKTALKSINLPETLVTIGTEAFYNTTNLKSLVLPPTVKTIGAYAFQKAGLETLYVPASVTTIGEYAFAESEITTVIFDEENSLSSLGQYTFYKCANLKKVQFSENSQFKSINAKTFYQCSLLSDINIPESVVSIYPYAFYETTSLTSVNLPSKLSYIGYETFYKSGLEKIVLPSTLKYTSSYSYTSDTGSGNTFAFAECKSLKEIELGASMHLLPDYMFYNCPIQKITCKSSTPPTIGSSAFTITKSNVTLVVPDFAVPAYKLSSSWLSFKIEGGATSDFWDIVGSVDMTNNRRFDGTPSVTLRNGRLKVSGNAAMPLDNFSMNADIYGSSTSNIYYSQLLNDSPLMTANSINYNYTMGSGKWYFLALPFDVNVDDFRAEIDPSLAVKYYDGARRAEKNSTGYGWQHVPAGTTLKAGTGFIMQSSNTVTKTFSCPGDGKTTLFNPNSVTTPLEQHPSESAAHSGWNLIGNPFPCRYDMYYSMLSCPIIVYDIANKTYTAKSMLDDGYLLRPTEAFFVQASEDLSEIVFSKQGKQFEADFLRPSSRPAERIGSEQRSLFNITLSCDGMEDNTRVVLNPEASCAYELNRDAAKFLSDNETIPQIYSISPEEDYLAINERDEADGTVRIGYYTPSSARMAISMTRIDGRAFLHDAVTGTTTELATNEEYHFIPSAAGFEDGRFTLRLIPQSTTGTTTVSEKKSGVSVCGGILTVTDTMGKDVTVTSLDGVLYLSATAATDSVEVALPSGLYIVKAGDTSVKCMVK